jgi:hypothetical protein
MRSSPEDRLIEAVSPRPGGWAVIVSGRCMPVFLPAGDGATSPAAGDTARLHPDGRVEVLKRRG